MQTITLETFFYNQKKFKAKRPISFEVKETQAKDNDTVKTFYSIENEDFNIEAFGDTLQDLSRELLDELAFNWERYALTNPDHLSEKAKAVRENYLETFKESL